MASSSLTKQAGFLMAGRFLSMPFAFLVPIVLARKFSLEEFGYYKQLFLIFNILLPIIDLGITNSLYYFMPRYPDEKGAFVGQALILTILPCIFSLACCLFIPEKIAQAFTHEIQIGQFISFLGFFAISWHLSNLFEVVLIVEKKAFGAGVVTFLSEAARSLVTIAIVLSGYGLKGLLVALVALGGCRCLFMAYYLLKKYDIDWRIKFVPVKKQLAYAVPFGVAVIVNGFIGNVHQYIVSVTSNAAEFAIFTVGCFQLPLLSVVVDSIAKTSLVRMAELRNHENSLEEIAQVISNSCRKLWLIFFPVFVFLFVIAEEFIEILFTTQYLDSVPIFRVFIFIIPLSAILIQHVPRAFNETNFILINNTASLAISVFLCWAGMLYVGILGVALGFIVANLIWKVTFLFKCKKILKTNISNILPFRELFRSGLIILIGGLIIYFFKNMINGSLYVSLVTSSCSFLIYHYWAYNYLGLLTIEEKRSIWLATKKFH